MDSNKQYEYFCSAEENGKVVDMEFRSNRFSVLEYKQHQEKLGRKVSVSAFEYGKEVNIDNVGIFHKCDTSNLKFPKRKGWSVRVLCLETGVIYNTIREFQQKHNIGNWVVRKVVYEGRECEGKHYRIID